MGRKEGVTNQDGEGGVRTEIEKFDRGTEDNSHHFFT